MKNKLHKIKNKVLLHLVALSLLSLLGFSIFIHYKNQIIEEHIQFLNAQIPTLNSENSLYWKEINRSAKMRMLSNEKINEFKPFINFLNDNTKPKTANDLKEIFAYLTTNLNAHDFLSKDSFDHLSKPYQNQLETYRIAKFQNELMNYLSGQVGVGASTYFSRGFSIVDFWSKEKYTIYLNYHPSDYVTTNMKINGKETNDNAILFKPQRIGKHYINISLTEFDARGTEHQLDFKKEIIVLP